MICINDFVIREDVCNMRCQYCLTGTSLFKKIESAGYDDKRLVYSEGTQLQKNIDEVTNRLFERFKPAILKISGGEILLIKGIIEYLKKHSKNYSRVQLLTNGLLLTHDIAKELSLIPNLCLQISLDHHTLDGNMHRTKDDDVLLKILNNLDYAVSQGINIEINCVLNDKNTHIIPSFAQYLLKYKGRVILLPFPVRGKEKNQFMPRKEQLSGIETLIKEYEFFCDILPPKIYLEFLYDFMKSGRRKSKCIFPKIALGSFDDGNITPCANYWFTAFGNVLHEDCDLVLDKVGSEKIYNVLCNQKHMLEECAQCFTPWEILNLYVEGLISIDELKRIPLYFFEGIETYLQNLIGEEK